MPDTPNLPIFLGADCVVLSRDEYMMLRQWGGQSPLKEENDRLRRQIVNLQGFCDAAVYRLQQFLDLAENFRDA